MVPVDLPLTLGVDEAADVAQGVGAGRATSPLGRLPLAAGEAGAGRQASMLAHVVRLDNELADGCPRSWYPMHGGQRMGRDEERTAESWHGGDSESTLARGWCAWDPCASAATQGLDAADSLKLDGLSVILGFQTLMRRAIPATGSGRRRRLGTMMPSANGSLLWWGPTGEASDEVTLRQKSWTAKRWEIWDGAKVSDNWTTVDLGHSRFQGQCWPNGRRGLGRVCGGVQKGLPAPARGRRIAWPGQEKRATGGRRRPALDRSREPCRAVFPRCVRGGQWEKGRSDDVGVLNVARPGDCVEVCCRERNDLKRQREEMVRTETRTRKEP